jgi:hypothetical protein
MDTLVTFTVAVAWTAVFALLAWGLATSWRRVMSDGDTLPIFGMLERRGLVLERLERSPDTLYGAVRRCAMCRERARCADWMAGRARGPAPDCPNASYMDDASRA